jgi:hypothetical protein
MERALSCDEELGASIAKDASSRLEELMIYIGLEDDSRSDGAWKCN